MNVKGLLISPFKSRRRLVIAVVVLAGLIFLGTRVFGNKSSAAQYQTAQAEQGTLVTSVSASGNITSGNRLDITTTASGIVDHVYVKNGDTVTQGQKIADILLDQDSSQKQSTTWAGYLSAKTQLASVQNNLYTLQAAEFTANQKFMNDAVMRGLDVTDPTYIEENAAWLAAEASYKNQTDVIAQARIALNSAWLNYQQSSSTITAPTSGTVTDLTLAQGLPITAQTGSSNSSSNTPQTVGDITLPQGHIQAIVNISEIDSTKVKPNQKVTMTLDALPGKTFTGTLLIMDTNGVVSSGVTTYPATIVFDTPENDIYPNMAVTAQIITSIKDNVILIPSAAIQTANGQSAVQIMKNNQPSTVNVTVGDSNDTQTEIISGVAAGDTVVTSVISPAAASGTGSTSTSPFRAFGGARGGGFGGGGGVIIRRPGGG